MGLYDTKKCIFTDLPVQSISSGRDAIEYVLEINSHRHVITLPYSAKAWTENNSFFKNHKHIFHSLLYNNKWYDKSNKEVIDIPELKALISKSTYPKTPNEKLDYLFMFLFRTQNEDGQKIILDYEYYKNIMWVELYFKSVRELNYYAQNLSNIDLIVGKFGDTVYNNGDLQEYNITFKGLNTAIELQEYGTNSNLCFIAMSFKQETMPIREAIKGALIKTGYKPIIIDEENIDSEKTINDAIIANLKKCNFCIADFSYHSNGVYFESGFALGQGKKVIYTCSKKEFANAHFDIKPLQHIIYETPEQLEKDLINKIEAWIK